MLYRLAVLGFFKNNWNLETKKEKVFTAEGYAINISRNRGSTDYPED